MSRLLPLPLVSFRELERYLALAGYINGLRVERVFVPESVAHPDGYFKKEWVLDLYSPDTAAQLYLSVRPQQAGLVVLPPKTLKPARSATRSGLDLSLTKRIEGLRIENILQVAGERVVRIYFSQSLELDLVLIPAQPEAVLFEKGELIASSKTRSAKDVPFTLPPAREISSEAILKIPLRENRFRSLSEYADLWFSTHAANALLLRKQRLETFIKTQADSLQRKKKSLEEQLLQSQNEPNWDRYGALLQTHFYAKPSAKDGFYELIDYEKNELVKIPADPKLQPKQQLERYFHSAKRNRLRLSETQNRIDALEEKLKSILTLQLDLTAATTLAGLETIEKKLGIGATQATSKSKEQKKLAEFSGKQYRSKEGLTILVGRSLNENLELTFKIARGNDLWLHVKGRPGSHAVILIPPKRTASLDTLLDAAQLCLLHSGGKEWGKTEVDYTARKHVKKIKNQTEVSYTHNKTLVVSVEEDRIKRLFAQE